MHGFAMGPAIEAELVGKSIEIDGIARQQGALGVDIGASVEAPVEPAIDAPAAETPEA